MKKFELAVIDGDEVVYNAGFASEQSFYEVYIRGEEDDGYLARFRYKKEG